MSASAKLKELKEQFEKETLEGYEWKKKSLAAFERARQLQAQMEELTQKLEAEKDGATTDNNNKPSKRLKTSPATKLATSTSTSTPMDTSPTFSSSSLSSATVYTNDSTSTNTGNNHNNDNNDNDNNSSISNDSNGSDNGNGNGNGNGIGSNETKAPTPILPKLPPRRFEENKSPSNLSRFTVIMVRTSGPTNLGMIARACATLGITDIRLVNPLCQVNCSESRKFACSHQNLLLGAPVFESLKDAITDIGFVVGTTARKRGERAGMVVYPEQMPALVQANPSERYAIVFGNESSGLSADELRLCNAYIHIPMSLTKTSYNLGHAVSIIMYTISRRLTDENFNELAEWPPKDSSFRASQKELTSFRAFAVQLLTRFNFNNMQGSDDKAADIDKKLSRAFQNMPIDASIIRFFYAVLRHVDQVAFKQNK